MMGGTLSFTANDDVNGNELWKSDGTALVKDINPGGTGSNISYMAFVVNSKRNTICSPGSLSVQESGRFLCRLPFCGNGRIIK
jgi:ELWxxDGT repeat protein